MFYLTRSLKISGLLLWALILPLAPLVFLYLRPIGTFQDPISARIVVLHVPMAWLATLGFLVSAIFAVRYLCKRQLSDDSASAAAAELGLLCCVLALATGMVFARTQWGSWWNSDPRETSIFYLLLIYGAYFALRGSVESIALRAVFSAVYSLLACLVMPYLVFVMPRQLPSLHPERAHMASSYWLVLWLTFAGFLTLLFQLFRVRCAMAGAAAPQQDVEPIEILRPTMVR